MLKVKIPADVADKIGRDIIYADEYDPSVHGRDLCCLDPTCGARFRFRSGGDKHGTHSRADHFFRFGQDHKPGCGFASDVDNPRISESFLDALRRGRCGLLNLNLNTGLTHTFSGHAAPVIHGPALELWRRTHSMYAALSINNIAELDVVLKRVEDLGMADARERVYVNFKDLRVVPVDEMIIDDDQEKTKSLLRNLVKDLKALDENATTREALYWYSSNIFGFPRVVCIDPSPTTRANSGKSLHIQTLPIKLSSTDSAMLLMRHSVNPEEQARRDAIVGNKSTYVLAVPYISRNMPKLIEAFKTGIGKTMVDLKWAVKSDDQFMAVPMFAPSPRLQTVKLDGPA